MNEKMGNLSRETGNITKNQMEILELKKYGSKNRQAHWKEAIAE